MKMLDWVPYSEFQHLNIDSDDMHADDWTALRAWYTHQGYVDGWEQGNGSMVHSVYDEIDAVAEFIFSDEIMAVCPQPYKYYFDWDAMARDEILGGNLFAVEISFGEWCVFFNN